MEEEEGEERMECVCAEREGEEEEEEGGTVDTEGGEVEIEVVAEVVAEPSVRTVSARTRSLSRSPPLNIFRIDDKTPKSPLWFISPD